MTSDVFDKIKNLLLNSDMEVDVLKSTAFDVYNKILEDMKPVDNIGYISDAIIRLWLTGFDYREPCFQREIDSFCEDISKLLHLLYRAEDKLLISVAAILIYAANTDIEQKEVNKVINDICSQNNVQAPNMKSEIDFMAKLFQNNIIGSQALEINSTSQMREVISSANEFLGVDCISSPSAECSCANSYMKTPKELGIDVELFLKSNQLVIQGLNPINPRDVGTIIQSFKIDASIIDFKKFTPTIYDILNIRFCWMCYWILTWIYNTPSEGTWSLMLNTVTGCLLETDKNFIESDNCYLTLFEIALNCLDYAGNGPSYYNHIRAKNLNYKEIGRYVQSHLNSVYGEMRELQSKILESLEKYGYCEPKETAQSAMESLMHVVSSDIKNMNQGNCLEGNGSTKDLYESMSAMQLLKLEQCLDQEQVSDGSDIKKLLGESFKLGTVLDEETARIKATFGSK